MSGATKNTAEVPELDKKNTSSRMTLSASSAPAVQLLLPPPKMRKMIHPLNSDTITAATTASALLALNKMPAKHGSVLPSTHTSSNQLFVLPQTHLQQEYHPGTALSSQQDHDQQIFPEQFHHESRVAQKCSPRQKHRVMFVDGVDGRTMMTTNKQKGTKKNAVTRNSDGSPLGPGIRAGRWSKEEHEVFLVGLHKYGKQWTKISKICHTRTVLQIRTHAQKYFKKLRKEIDVEKNGGNKSMSISAAQELAKILSIAAEKKGISAEERELSEKAMNSSKHTFADIFQDSKKNEISVKEWKEEEEERLPYEHLKGKRDRDSAPEVDEVNTCNPEAGFINKRSIVDTPKLDNSGDNGILPNILVNSNGSNRGLAGGTYPKIKCSEVAQTRCTENSGDIKEKTGGGDIFKEARERILGQLQHNVETVMSMNNMQMGPNAKAELFARAQAKAKEAYELARACKEMDIISRNTHGDSTTIENVQMGGTFDNQNEHAWHQHQATQQNVPGSPHNEAGDTADGAGVVISTANGPAIDYPSSSTPKAQEVPAIQTDVPSLFITNAPTSTAQLPVFARTSSPTPAATAPASTKNASSPAVSAPAQTSLFVTGAPSATAQAPAFVTNPAPAAASIPGLATHVPTVEALAPELTKNAPLAETPTPELTINTPQAPPGNIIQVVYVQAPQPQYAYIADQNGQLHQIQIQPAPMNLGAAPQSQTIYTTTPAPAPANITYGINEQGQLVQHVSTESHPNISFQVASQPQTTPQFVQGTTSTIDICRPTDMEIPMQTRQVSFPLSILQPQSHARGNTQLIGGQESRVITTDTNICGDNILYMTPHKN